MGEAQTAASTPRAAVLHHVKSDIDADVLCRGQGDALTIDRRDLHAQLHSLLLDTPLQPLAAEEDDPLDDDLMPTPGDSFQR